MERDKRQERFFHSSKNLYIWFTVRSTIGEKEVLFFKCSQEAIKQYLLFSPSQTHTHTGKPGLSIRIGPVFLALSVQGIISEDKIPQELLVAGGQRTMSFTT
jgi:hypothetical protein